MAQNWNQFCQNIWYNITNNKLLTFLGLCTFIFVICTIALASEKNSAQNKLNACRNEVDELMKNTTEAPPISSTTVKPGSEGSYRLPTDVEAISYDIQFQTLLSNDILNGTVTIKVLAKEDTDKINLNAHTLFIVDNSVKIKCENDTNIAVQNHQINETLQQLQINLNKPLKKGFVADLSISFFEKTNKLVGLISTTYKESSKTIKLVSSKFEPTFARQAFPCFDEPAMKAKFKVRLAIPKQNNYMALSNMPVAKITNDTTSRMVEFEESVKMSTYLAAFLVSDLDHVAAEINPKEGLGAKIPLKVYATREQIKNKNADFARDTAKKIMEYYIDYFQIQYPLPKLDLAAIPDFPSGAMETWGLVTFRQTSILYDAATSSTANKERVASVIAHELAHMWFGNLVTMKWWNDLWLNEGFASYIEYKGTDFAYPDWNIKEQFIIDDMHGVLALDSTIGSHPIVQTVETPNQITEIFDTITYAKGASIIRMIESYLGEETFKLGITNYLKKYAYDNAVTDDLVNEWSKLYEKEDVAELIATWTKQKGFPVLNMKFVNEKLILTQARFLSNPDSKETEVSEYEYKWSIPVTYFTSMSDAVQSVTFNHKDNELSINLSKDLDWIKLNKNQVGYYRVNYPTELWGKFQKLLAANHTSLETGDRSNLLDDAFSLAHAKQLDFEIALDITKYLKAEDQYVPWVIAIRNFKKISSLLYEGEYYTGMIKYTNALVNNTYNKFKWENKTDNHMQNLLRTAILDFTCSESVGKEICLDNALEEFKKWLIKPSENLVDSDLKSIIYYYGMQKSGSEGDWNQVFNLYETTNDAQEKIKLMHALTAIQDKRILSKLIKKAEDENVVKKQDFLNLLGYISQNRVGEPLVWDYVRGNWNELVAKYGLSERNLGRLIPTISKRFCTEVRKQEMEDFFVRNSEAGAGANARKQALEQIENNIKWLQEHEKTVGNWLLQN